MKKITTIMSLIFAFVMIVSVNNALAAKKNAAEMNSDSMAVASTIADKIDINSANEELLLELPGVGPKTAERINAYREANGPFKTVEDLLNIKGIGPKVLDKIRPYVKVS